MKSVYFDEDKTYDTIARQRNYNNKKKGVINYLLRKGIVHTRTGANLLLIVAFLAMSGLTSYLWDSLQPVNRDYFTDRDGTTYHVDDYVEKVKKDSKNFNNRN